MYKEFCITGIKESIANKTITVETNFKLDKKSVTLSNVNLKVNSTGELVDYSLIAENKNIIIQFKDWPSPNVEYYLSITNITDALDRPVKQPFSQIVIFESAIKQKIAFIKPTCDEAIKSNVLEVNVKATPEDEPVKGYYYEIASDVAFCDPIKKIPSAENTIQVTDLPYGQSFIRARVQDLEDSTSYGEWSEPISFVMINNKCECDPENNTCNCIEEDNPFIDDILSIDTVLEDVAPIELIGIPANGMTKDSIYLVFDKEINPSSVPKTIIAYRRDL